jgi:uncharacterized protein (DUF2235 family)
VTEPVPNAAAVRKRLVLFCDGTWNNADIGGADTNVARLSRAVHATTGTGGVLQCALYLRGVGTTGLEITRNFDGATGFGIDDNIKSAYSFIAQNFVPGDEIYLFGFSRGAFTARSLVGLISAVGLMKRQSLQNLGHAWDYYRDQQAFPHSPAGFATWCAKKQCPPSDVHDHVAITFLGVWDTVGALGIPGHLFDILDHELYGFYNTDLSPIVQRAYQALAIDEHRDAFVPTLWTGTIPAGAEVEQVWFAGAHADVGGGYIVHELADIPLLWMAGKARDAGLVLDWSCLPDPTTVNPAAARHNSSSRLFVFNRLLPTYREVCGQSFPVHAFQTLYTPTDRNHQPLIPIREFLHASVLTRFGRTSEVSPDDKPGGSDTETYRPENVAALFNDRGALKPDIETAH